MSEEPQDQLSSSGEPLTETGTAWPDTTRPENLVDPDGSHIDVTETVGGAAVEATQEPVTESTLNPYPDRVEDPDKALAMASAGDNLRTHAAVNRHSVKDYEGYRGQLDEAGDDEIAKAQTREEFSRKPYFYMNNGKVESTYGAEGEVPEEYELGSRIRESRIQAGYSDRDAEKWEEWAGILHDHPISDEYKAAHPEVNFEIRSLVRLEQGAAEDDRLANIFESHAKDLEEHGYMANSRHMGSMNRGIHELIIDMEHEAEDGRDYEGEWDKLRTNPNTTLGELGRFKADLVRKTEVTKYRNRANVVKALLEDIRSGKASK